MSNILKIAGAGVSAAEETDENFNQTVLLLHGDGTNGAQNNTFLDSSTNNFTITRNGNTTQGTFSPFSTQAGGWSNYFDGTGDAFRASASSLSMSSFTVEAWLNYSGDANIRTFYDFANGLSGYGILAVYANTLSAIRFQFFSTNSVGSLIGNIDVTWTSYFNKWTHVACTYDGSTYRVFVNGTLAGSLSSATSVVAINHLAIGGRAETTPSQNWQGYMSNFRFVTGAALYTSDFTPSTTPLTTAGSGTTQFIFAQSNRFVDTEGNYTFTIFGNPKVTPFSPFAPTAAYSASVNGGSGYFDGSETYLQVSNAGLAIGTDDFSIQFWVYNNAFDGASGNNTLFDYRNGSEPTTQPVLFMTNGQLKYYINGSLVITGETLKLGEWSFIGLSRVSGTTKLFVNGVQSGSNYTDTNNYTSSVIRIAADYDSILNAGLNGYLSGFKITQGAAVDFSTLGVPTTPPTADANTELLLNFTNAGIFDNTGKNNLETVGNAQIDTTTKKYGTGAMEFDGTGDYLVCDSGGQDLAFGSGAFTVEFWVYINTVKNNGIIDFRPNGTASGAYVTLYQESGGTIRLYVNGADRITGASLSASTWYHIALTRSGTDTKLFVNGSQSGSTYTDSTVYLNPSNRPVIGHISDNVADTVFPLNGFIDDLRITKGVARYTSNFTAPTKAFPDL